MESITNVASVSSLRRKRARADRIKRRLAVRFTCDGTDAFRSGYTTNVSETGLFVRTHRPPKLGSVVALSLVVRGGRHINVQVVVARLEVPPPQFRSFVASGFGAKFVNGALSMTELELSAPALERQG